VIEEYFGTLWGLAAGMVFGVGEILWEWRTRGKVDPITWGGNGVLLVLGGISLVTQEGIWFKLQPALLEIFFAIFLWGSLLLKKSLLLSLAQKQGSLPKGIENTAIGKKLKLALDGMTLRMGFFFALHAILAVWAALYWSTAAWALLKGVGLTVSLIVYGVVESLILRYRVASNS
jgi:intracellular septation protein